MSDQADTATFHIVRYHQAWMEDQRLYIQTELCTTTLSAEIEQNSPALISTERRYKFLREICLALEFIHLKGMVHLDIKPENIFIKNDQFKLGDFGLVSKVSSHDVEEGDSRYMSMELLSGDHADLTKSDIFSLGISLYEICLGGVRSLPKNGQEWQSLREANFLPLANTPGEMQRMIKAMMNSIFRSRPSAHELLKRPQLLSAEQKALLAERNKVVQANLALAEQANRLKKLAPPPVPSRKPLLVRANTWNGS
jgi:wee1-like protein kinase